MSSRRDLSSGYCEFQGFLPWRQADLQNDLKKKILENLNLIALAPASGGKHVEERIGKIKQEAELSRRTPLQVRSSTEVMTHKQLINSNSKIMKKLVKKLPVVAFVFALVAAFAFNMPKEEVLATHWFELDELGNIGNSMPSSSSCEGDGVYCAVGLNDDQVDDLTGEPLYTSISGIEDEVQIAEKR